jgi:hypothetical protein
LGVLVSVRKLSLLGFVAALFAVQGCASEPGADGAEPAGDDEAELAGAKCFESPRRYELSLAEGHACEDIRAHGGRWVARPLFGDAPASLRDRACIVKWSPSRRNAPPDPTVLAAAPGVLMVAPDCTGARTCSSASACSTVEANVQQIPFEPEPDIVPYTGASGCDVCGVVSGGKIWVIDPPWLLPGTRKINVGLTGGAARTFVVDKPAGVQAYAVTLPPPPPGQSYVEGRIKIR